MKVAETREKLLDDARRYSPISLVLAFNKLPQTVLVRIIWFPITWIILVTYVTVASLTRSGYIDLKGQDSTADHVSAYNGASVMVTFMVVFYLGYCYNRHWQIYEASRSASSTVLNLCVAARACLGVNERRKLFVYLNLMQVSAYCALTPVYSRENFMDTFCREHVLELPVVEHEAAFGKLDLPPSLCSNSEPGASAYQCCAVWAVKLLERALHEGALHGESYRIMMDDVLKARSLLNSLFAYQYQVIPFVYSHLVSAGSFLYLLGLAVLKAAALTPDVDLLSGLVLPLLSFLIAVITTIGLIEIGQAIANPWGIDPEDFAVPKFLQVTAKASRLLVELDEVDPLASTLANGEPVDIGNPDLRNIASECGSTGSQRDSHAAPARPTGRFGEGACSALRGMRRSCRCSTRG